MQPDTASINENEANEDAQIAEQLINSIVDYLEKNDGVAHQEGNFQ